MPKPVEIKACPNYRLWLKYDDGIEGEVDLSHLAGRGVFRAWGDPAFFAAVRIGPQGQIEWGDTIDLCPDATYMRLTGKSPDQVFPHLKQAEVDA